VSNLYPFAATVAAGGDRAACVEKIDVGGPAMIRGAAKNHDHVAVVTDVSDYPLLLAALSAPAELAALRRRLAWKAFAHCAAYDSQVAEWLAANPDDVAEIFLDNRVAPDAGVAHGGSNCLTCVSVPPARGMVTAKASLSTELLHFVKGDDVWISLWCRVPADSGMPFTVLDLETTWIEQHPGIRVVIEDGRHVCLQLKSLGNPSYRQPRGKEVEFPRGRWVRLRLHLGLTETPDGVIEVWQDERKIIDTRGQTLVLARAIYNSLEIGITAYNEQGRPATLHIDDVAIGTEPFTE
jgi:hypothetical protein